jgi:hypothetical protein
MKDLIARQMKKIREMDLEIFLVESYYNHYQPEPPKGFFGVRSHKRGLFMPLENGSSVPRGEKINQYIRSGEYIEHPL